MLESRNHIAKMISTYIERIRKISGGSRSSRVISSNNYIPKSSSCNLSLEKARWC